MARKPDKRRTELTPKEQMICDAYLSPDSPTFGVYVDSYFMPEAGNKPGASRNADRVHAHEFFYKPKIVAYIAKVKVAATERVLVTRESLTVQLLEDRALAYTCEQAGAAVSASSAMMKLHGWDVHKHEFSGPEGGPMQTEDLTGMSEEERNQRLAALIRKLKTAADETSG